MGEPLQLGDVAVEVVRKDIKHAHLSVHPPTGRVRLALPRHVTADAARAFAIGKLGWIRRQQAKLRAQEREPPREYLPRESHQVWGRRRLLAIVEHDGPPAVELRHRRLTLYLRPGTSPERRGEILEAWYREELRAAAAPLLTTWQARLGVEVARLHVRRMRTRWGSCNVARRAVRLNTDLAKKPPGCLEYVLVHELMHLLEPTHNARFVALMDQFLPGWEGYRELLNQLPVRHDDWD